MNAFWRVPAQTSGTIRPTAASITEAPTASTYLPKEAFNDAPGYYGTALHELSHWTGHPFAVESVNAQRILSIRRPGIRERGTAGRTGEPFHLPPTPAFRMIQPAMRHTSAPGSRRFEKIRTKSSAPHMMRLRQPISCFRSIANVRKARNSKLQSQLRAGNQPVCRAPGTGLWNGERS